MAYDRPFRLRVLDALTDCLKGITPAGGYANDLSQAVFRGRVMFGEGDPLPMVSILEPPIPVDQRLSPFGSEASSGDWELQVQGFVDDDPLNPTDPAHFLAADVRRALAAARKAGAQSFNILGMGGLVEDMAVGAPVVRPTDEVSAKAYFWMPLTLRIVEDMEAPFS